MSGDRTVIKAAWSANYQALPSRRRTVLHACAHFPRLAIRDTVARLFNDDADNLPVKLIGLYVMLIAANLLAWGCAFIAFHDRPVLMSTALLAYAFGLRHAFDADHIAAIDNVTRKLMQGNKRPVTAGFFFSLGHSSVVIALSLAIAAMAAGLQTSFTGFRAVGSVVGTGISALFLFTIAAANLLVLVNTYKTFQRVKHGGHLVEQEIDLPLTAGLLGRIFRRVFGLIASSWHMYPVGMLFALSFDTATEIGLLGISASEASHGSPIWSILIFVALFTAGMSLADTFDSTLMLGTYGWALINPIRKLHYNMIITFVSVFVALLIGGVELVGVLIDEFSLRGPIWGAIGNLAENFAILGLAIVGVFAAAWAVSVVIYRVKGFGKIKVIS